MKRLRLMSVLDLPFLLVALPSFAATITVPTDVPTIQAGIDAANPGDIVLVLPGVYTEHIVMDGADSGIVVMSSSPGSAILDGGDTGRLFTCSSLLAGSAIRDFTIRNGRAAGSGWPEGGGGGILATNCALTIEGNTMTANYAGYDGGAIDLVRGTADVRDNTLIGNTAVLDGGAIRVYQTDGVISGNHIEGNIILGNGAGGGAGGGIATGGSATTSIRNNQVLNNHAAESGPGGIYLGDFSNCEVLDNFIRGNSAPHLGGGIRFRLSNGIIAGNVIVFNSCPSGGGGGIRIDAGATATIRSNTLYGNSALSGAGLIINGSANVHHNIVASNEIGGGITCVGGTSLACNDVWGNTPEDSDCSPGPGDFSEDPSFCSVPEEDFRIAANSPCVDGYGCGLVGALGIGCGPTAVLAVSWGALKARYQ